MLGTIKKVFRGKSVAVVLLVTMLFVTLADIATPTAYAYDWSKAPYSVLSSFFN